MTASRRSLGSLPYSQQQTRSSWSLLCNAGPPFFQKSGRIPSTPAALPLFICSMVLISSCIQGSSSSSTLTGIWGMRRSAESWTTRSALKSFWKCSDQRLRIDILFEECPSIRIAQTTPCLVCRAIHCLESFIKACEITSICVLLSSNYKVGPPFVLHHSKLELEIAANVVKSSFLDKTGRVGQVGLVG